MDIYLLLAVGLVVRLGLVAYGEWQDQNMAVKFTDIDYHVFTDAAAYMTQGESPYQRATYRYTPLLAWMLQPNILWTPLFGKLLFILLDIYTGYLTYQIVLSSGSAQQTARICATTWLFNPLPMTVSSRGNAESIMSCLVLLSLKLIRDKMSLLAGIVYAASVHFKIYPAVYAIPIYLNLDMDSWSREEAPWKTLLPTKTRLIFITSAALTFTGLILLFYHLYGWEFLEHTYLYHVTRKDIRHNFSVYFYLLYQQSADSQSLLLALLSFAPQVLLLLVFSFIFYTELPLVYFLNTFVFVTFNKVCTSQYFLWYLCILPLLLPNLSEIPKIKAVCIVALWFAGQGIWLLPAYYLEFEGVNTFLYLWCASLVFFLINCYIMYAIIDVYRPAGQTVEKTDNRRVRYTKTSLTSTSTEHRTCRSPYKSPSFYDSVDSVTSKSYDIVHDAGARLKTGKLSSKLPVKRREQSVKSTEDMDNSEQRDRRSYSLRTRSKHRT